MSHHPLGWVPLQVTVHHSAGVGCRGDDVQGGGTHIHVVLQNLWSGVTLLDKAQPVLDAFGDGIHIWDLPCLSQDPPHGRELGQGDPVWGGQTC